MTPFVKALVAEADGLRAAHAAVRAAAAEQVAQPQPQPQGVQPVPPGPLSDPVVWQRYALYRYAQQVAEVPDSPSPASWADLHGGGRAQPVTATEAQGLASAHGYKPVDDPTHTATDPEEVQQLREEFGGPATAGYNAFKAVVGKDAAAYVPGAEAPVGFKPNPYKAALGVVKASAPLLRGTAVGVRAAEFATRTRSPYEIPESGPAYWGNVGAHIVAETVPFGMAAKSALKDPNSRLSRLLTQQTTGKPKRRPLTRGAGGGGGGGAS